jgi:hypothetical protein
MYAARTRNGFTPASRAERFKKLKALEIKESPFANLPEKKACASDAYGSGWRISLPVASCREW